MADPKLCVRWGEGGGVSKKGLCSERGRAPSPPLSLSLGKISLIISLCLPHEYSIFGPK